MRHQTHKFLAKFLEEHGVPDIVLEVGSRSIQGAGTLRHYFTTSSQFVGLDMIKGDGVDLVLNAHDIKDTLSENSFDMVLCFDTLEHDDKFWVTVENMKWVLKPGGYLLIGVPSRNCPLHEHPSDYWRFMEPAAYVMMEGMVEVVVLPEIHPENQIEDEIYFYGRKP